MRLVKQQVVHKFQISWQTIILILSCVGFSFGFYWTEMSDDNISYAIEQIHYYDASIFAGNICVQGAEYSPKLFANALTSALMHVLNINWAVAAGLIIQANYVLYGLAAASAAMRISTQNRLLYGMIIVFCCHANTMGSLGFGLFGAPDVFLGTGIAFALIGISCVVGEQKNWSAAWICAALAALMHVHEGMWGGCMLGVIWLALCACNRRINWKDLKSLPVFIIAILFVALPSVLFGSPVDDKTFVDIYAFFRTPHHLVPTSWSIQNILICLGLAAMPSLCISLFRIIYADREILRERLYIGAASVLLWLALFALEVFVTELVPSATVVSMYVTKCFKYVTFISLLLMLSLSDTYLRESKYISAALCLGIIICGQPHYKATFMMSVTLLLFNIFMIEQRALRNIVKSTNVGSMAAWLFASVMLARTCGTKTVLIAALCLLFAVRFLRTDVLRQKAVRLTFCAATLGVMVMFMNGKVYTVNGGNIDYISGETDLVNRTGKDFYQLSMMFRDMTSEGDIFLADPYDAASGRVQLVSERNCYVVHKNLPTSASVVIEWYRRLKQVDGITEMSGEELVNLMQETGAKYILLRPQQYAAAEKCERLKLLIKNDAAAFFVLQ